MSIASCCFSHQLSHVLRAGTRQNHADFGAIISFHRFSPQTWNPHSARRTQQFSTTKCRRDEQIKSPISSAPIAAAAPIKPNSTASQPSSDPKVHHVADEQLPSHRRNQQWTLSRRFHTLMDKAMTNLTLASQQINNYTGTDYSGIEALRREITEQEQLVRARYTTMQQAKVVLNEAQEKRTSSATDLVALLERKHSWTSPDLEKYMSLVRSEHTNDKAVQTAKENMDRAEQALEDSRIRLEKRERAQYHEEQIWSDTIRRNSTWVTIGLMGLNIFILLFNLVAIEPWRRKRLVREVRSALEEKAIAPLPLAEAAEILVPAEDVPVLNDQEAEAYENQAIDSSEFVDVKVIVQEPVPSSLLPSEADSISWNERIRNYIKGFFSDKIVSMQMIELTAIAIQSAAGGATVAWLLVLLMLIPY